MKLPPPKPKTKKERAKQLSEDVVTTMAYISHAIKVAYLGSDLEDSTDNDDKFWVPGNALKMSNKKWQLVLKTGKMLLIEESELLDSKRWYVK
jgi:hypothetical protein